MKSQRCEETRDKVSANAALFGSLFSLNLMAGSAKEQNKKRSQKPPVPSELMELEKPESKQNILDWYDVGD